MTAADGSRGERERILFVSSNGTGLGHLTRSMAIARRLEGMEPLFFTLEHELVNAPRYSHTHVAPPP